MVPAEGPEGLELPRRQERHQVEQLFEVVLHRCGGEEQQIGPAEPVDELPEDCPGVPQVMGLVDDDQIVGDLENPVGVLRSLGRVKRRDHALEPPPGLGPFLPERLGVMSHEVEAELPAKLLLPLCHQPGRDEDQHSPGPPPAGPPPCHCATSPDGTRTSARRASRLRKSSDRMIPASTVLPSPTSSASSARPRMRLST